MLILFKKRLIIYLGLHQVTLLGPAGWSKRTRGLKDRYHRELRHDLCRDSLVPVHLAPWGA